MGDIDMKKINESRNEEEAVLDYQNARQILEKRKTEIERTVDDHLIDLYS